MIVTTYFGKKQGLKFKDIFDQKKKKKIVAKGLRMVQFGEKIKKKILTQN